MPARLAGLDTERSRPELADLDERSSAELVDLLTAEDAEAVRVVRAAAPAITSAADLVVDRLAGGGRLVYAGAGTAGRLAVLDAAELVPTYGIEPRVVRALLAGGQAAMVASVEGAEDDAAAARRDLDAVAPDHHDVVVGISASGRTPYVLAVVEAARAVGAATVGVVNNRGSELAALAELAIELPTGPEVVAGSTRMKAGTSQKLVLNALSTVAMIRLGKVYRNLMVDLRATNEKLRIRAARIVVEATGAADGEARAALDAAGGHAKCAVVMLLAGVDADEAARRLAETGGRVRDAVVAGTDRR
ncbi:MAG: N-acetylmuramic acid 6-phosphate etherase [Pseudonocardia sp.]|nr:N-acetylmuramic acid 6-phosphate etherase [Pseudonocardia sp.]